jgi:oligopeptide/dipeptide ABC transporter ATP-binding protein
MAKLSFVRRPRGVTQYVCLVLLAALAFLALFGHTIWAAQAARFDPARPLQPASSAHILGTDQIGRDVLARVLNASLLSVELALMAAAIGVVIGVTIGVGQAVLGPFLRRLLASAITISLAFPGLLLALLVNAIFGAGPTGAVLGVGIALIPAFARFSQALASSAAGSEYVAAARVLGVGRVRIMVRHILPNIAKPLLLTALGSVGTSLVGISALSFLGLGVQPPNYDWGELLQAGLQVVYIRPMSAIGPGLMIVLAGLAFNLAGEAFAGSHPRISVGEFTGSAGLTRRFALATSRLANRRPDRAADADELVVAASASPKLLSVRDLHVAFPGRSGPVAAVRDVDLAIVPGERLGVVGESGSGKTTLALALACLLERPATWRWGEFTFDGESVKADAHSEYRRLFGTKLGFVFQDPANSLNPAIRVGAQLAELRQVHYGASRAESRRMAVDRLREVQIPSPEIRARQYPHEFSGGMRQRAMIASGLMGSPRLLIADEPTTALDVTVQAHILRLLERVSDETGAAVLLISHDISVVVSFCHRVLVMYAGRVVEDIPSDWLVSRAAHPYTRALIHAVPDIDDLAGQPLTTIPGQPPNLENLSTGCSFAARCAFADDKCREDDPVLTALAGPHSVACWHPRPSEELADELTDAGSSNRSAL